MTHCEGVIQCPCRVSRYALTAPRKGDEMKSIASAQVLENDVQGSQPPVTGCHIDIGGSRRVISSADAGNVGERCRRGSKRRPAVGRSGGYGEDLKQAPNKVADRSIRKGHSIVVRDYPLESIAPSSLSAPLQGSGVQFTTSPQGVALGYARAHLWCSVRHRLRSEDGSGDPRRTQPCRSVGHWTIERRQTGDASRQSGDFRRQPATEFGPRNGNWWGRFTGRAMVGVSTRSSARYIFNETYGTIRSDKSRHNPYLRTDGTGISGQERFRNHDKKRQIEKLRQTATISSGGNHVSPLIRLDRCKSRLQTICCRKPVETP